MCCVSVCESEREREREQGDGEGEDGEKSKSPVSDVRSSLQYTLSTMAQQVV